MGLRSPRTFRFLSRSFIATYGRWPLFGELRSSVGLLRRADGAYLLQRRSDGLGWAFPGGTSKWREPADATLRREWREETGMEITGARLLYCFHDREYVPGMVSVYVVEATGDPRGSWEGEVSWEMLERVQAGFFRSQLPILELLHGRELAY